MSKQSSSGIGLDVGTAFLVTARMNGDEIVFDKLRDVFYPMIRSDDSEAMLGTLEASYVADERNLFVIGEDAMMVANSIEGARVHRPMTSGVITRGDAQSGRMLELLLKRVLGKPAHVGEACFYSIPAEPINAKQKGFFNTEYHTDKVNKILRGLGFEGKPVNEASCIAFDQLRKHKLTGAAISFGAGMVNIAQLALSIPSRVFSIIGSGDYVDEKVADQFGMTPSQVARVKERGYKQEGMKDLVPIHVIHDIGHADPIIDAICLAYERMVDNVVKNMKIQFDGATIEEAIPIVLAGGTTLISGFKELFEKAVKRNGLPFEVSQVIHADNPFYAVARGAMYRAIVEETKLVKKQTQKVQTPEDSVQ